MADDVVKIVNGTLSTGVSTQDISLGTGFGTPGYARLVVVHQTGTGLNQGVDAQSIGFFDGTNSCFAYHFNDIQSGTMDCQRGNGSGSAFRIDNGAGTTLVAGTMSFGTDKVTLSYTTQPSSAWRFSLRVIESSNVSGFECGYHDGTTQTITTGFDCSDEYVLGEFHGASTDSVSTSNAAANFGYYSNGNQACWRYGGDDGTTAPDFFAYFDDDAVCRNIFGPTGVFDKLKVTATSATGFTLTQTSGPEQGIYAMLRLANERVAVGTSTTTAATGAGDAVSGLGWQPGFVGVAGICSTTVDTIFAEESAASVFHGDYDGTSYFSNLHTMLDLTGAPFSEYAESHYNTVALIQAREGEDNSTDTVVTATVDSLDSGGFTLNKSAADFTTRFVYVAIETSLGGSTEITIDESESAVFGESMTLTEQLPQGSESAVFGEDLSVTESFSEGSESASFGESMTLTEQLPQGSESMTFGESMSITVRFTLAESLAFGEDLSAEENIDESESAVFGESMTLTEQLPQGSESAVFGEDLSVVEGTSQGESLSFGETLSVESSGFVIQESLSFGESLSVGMQIFIDESLVFAEQGLSAQTGEFVPSIWGRYKEIDVNTDFVVGQAKENFPLLITIDDPEIIAQVRGDMNDLVITDEFDNKLDHEVDFFNGSVIKVWVKIPSLAKAIQEFDGESLVFGEALSAVGGTETVSETESLAFGETERTSPFIVLESESLIFAEYNPQGSGQFVTSITQNGITWTFDQQYFAGQYITGDWWILGTPNVGVLSVSPSWNGTGNGSSINPPVSNQYGYGTWLGYYNAAYRATFPATLTPGDSLVSTVEHPDAATTGISAPDYSGINVSSTHSKIDQAEILTCVSSIPSPTAFRPPYSGSIKPTYDFNTANLGILPSLALQAGPYYGNTAQVASASDFPRLFARPWILHVSNWVGRPTHPRQNMPNYHREVYGFISDAACLLISDIPLATKREIAIGLIQIGIDTYYINQEGSPDSSANKFPNVLAGILLNEPELYSEGYDTSYRPDYMVYNASEKTHPVTSSVVPPGEFWTGATVGWRQDPGTQEHENFDPYTEADIPSGGWRARENYRRLNTAVWVGINLACRLIPGAQAAYAYPDWFTYMDRWMTEADLSPFNHSPYSVQNGGSPFAKNMWLAHR